MPRLGSSDLTAFVTIARERSFTRAATKMGLSPSALSHSINRLEGRVGVRLLSRTTRSVVVTEAGGRLLRRVGPRLDEINEELEALSEQRDKPAGTIRIAAAEDAGAALLLTAAARLLPEYPDIRLEVTTDAEPTDVVADRCDAAVRAGNLIERDMASVPLGPELRLAVAGSPGYFKTRSKPRVPQDLTQHNCINLRRPATGGVQAWEFEKDRRKLQVRTEGQLIFSSGALMLDAALAGLGLVCRTEAQLAPHLDGGRLVRVLADWCEPFPGYRLYYPSRREPSLSFGLLLEALRCCG